MTPLEQIIAAHVIVAWGMSVDSKDECSCGLRISPDDEQEPWERMEPRRRRGYAKHLASEIRSNCEVKS